jgi:hypothetical protein
MKRISRSLVKRRVSQGRSFSKDLFWYKRIKIGWNRKKKKKHFLVSAKWELRLKIEALIWGLYTFWAGGIYVAMLPWNPYSLDNSSDCPIKDSIYYSKTWRCDSRWVSGLPFAKHTFQFSVFLPICKEFVASWHTREGRYRWPLYICLPILVT